MAIGGRSGRVKALGELVLSFGGGVTLVLYNENLVSVESFLKSGEIGIWGEPSAGVSGWADRGLTRRLPILRVFSHVQSIELITSLEMMRAYQ